MSLRSLFKKLEGLHKAQEWTLASGAGVFGGSLAGYLSQNLFQKNAILGSPWPAVITLFLSSFVAISLAKTRKWTAGILAPCLILVSIFAACVLRDSSGDGLGYYAERIYQASQRVSELKELDKKSSIQTAFNPSDISRSVGFGLIFANILCTPESAKWVNFAWSMSGGLMIFGALNLARTGRPLGTLIFLLVICQPVVLYQCNTLYKDIQLAAAFSGFFAGVILLFNGVNFRNLFLLLLTTACLFNTKSLAIGYLAILLPLLILTLILHHFKKSWIEWQLFLFTISLSLSFCSPLVFKLKDNTHLQQSPFLEKRLLDVLFFINPVVLDPKSTDGVHSGCGPISHYAAQMFWWRHFSATKRGGEKIQIKSPFWLSRPELDVFSDLTPDLRFGGYGPLFSTAVLLAIFPGILLLGTKNSELAGWKWILLACLVMIPVTPSWWARWFPQGWWIPLAASVGFLCGPPDWQAKFKWVAWLARLGLLALGLNSLLILIFTVKGYCEAETFIRRQLAFLKTLPAPLVIETGHFTATRFWLDQKNISYSQEKIPGNSASVVLYRTTLRVRLSDEDLKQIEQDPDHLKFLRRHKLLNLPPQSQSGG